MDRKRRQMLRLTAAATMVPALARIGLAQAYPSRPVRLVVGFPAGGPVDIAARLIAPWLAERLGQPFVVDNQPDGSGNGATRSVVSASPDGYTLLVCAPVNTINTTLFPGLDFDFARDIVPVASLWSVPLVIEVNPSVPVRTISAFIAHAQAYPGKIRVGVGGRGTPQHIGIELFKMMARVELTLIPYLGSTPVLNDLLAGKLDAMFDPLPSSIAHIKNGKLIPLAVTASSRSEALPDVPVAADTVPGYETGSWFGIGAPRGTPSSIVDVLNREVNVALQNEDFRSRLARLGATTIPGSPDRFGRFILDETEKYTRVIREMKITAE